VPPSIESGARFVLIDPLKKLMIGCRDALLVSPAMADVADIAWWIERGGASFRYPHAPVLLLRAAQAYMQGFDRGCHDRIERKRKDDERRRAR
jgi:hypothetical protein